MNWARVLGPRVATAVFIVTVALGGIGADVAAAGPGRHLAIPALGIHQPIYRWGCHGGTLPDRVWSWGCSGHNNLYLLGHAYGAFKPVHDAFATHTLTKGMTLRLRTETGKVLTFHLAWVRKVHASELGTDMWGPGRTWAWNATPRRVVTLQTCWGRRSQDRIIVRFRLSTRSDQQSGLSAGQRL